MSIDVPFKAIASHVMRNTFLICEPETYYSQDVQDSIAKARSQEHHSWIFDIRARETILLDREQYSLCSDKPHASGNIRFLIIFHDKALHTLRDLRQSHCEMLLRAREDTNNYLKRHYPEEKWCFYFNYLPSIYQLHAHVCQSCTVRNASRCHDLLRVVRNLYRDDLFYTKALLLTRMARSNVLYDILSKKTMSGIELDICYAWRQTSNTQQSNHGQSGLTCPLAPAQVIISSISQATQTCMKDIDIQT